MPDLIASPGAAALTVQTLESLLLVCSSSTQYIHFSCMSLNSNSNSNSSSKRGRAYQPSWCASLRGAHVCMLQVLVFNCDGEFDFKSVGRIFMGLVKCGAWGCFDEFNRLEEDVLSAVSQQIQLIQVCVLSVCCLSADPNDTGV